MLPLIFILFISAPFSWAVDPNFELEQLSYKELIGTYQGFTGDEIGSLFIQDGYLQFYYASFGMVYRHFSLPISLQNSKKYYRSMGIFFDSDEIIYDRTGNTILITRTYKNRFQKMVDVTQISLISGTQLKIKRSRKYYRKKHIFYGPWVLDTDSYISKSDSINLTYYYFKSSPNPTTFTYLSNFAQIQKEIYLPIPNDFIPFPEQLNEVATKNATSTVTGQVIKLNDFRKMNCNFYLKNLN